MREDAGRVNGIWVRQAGARAAALVGSWVKPRAGLPQNIHYHSAECHVIKP